MSSTYLQLTDVNFEELILRSPVPALVAFCSSQCGPSQKLGPTLTALAMKYGSRARIGRFEVEANSATSTQYGVQATPVVLLFSGGRPAERIVGLPPEELLQGKLDDQIRRKP